MRARGKCPTCNRNDVTLMSHQPGAECAVCQRLTTVVHKLQGQQPLTTTDSLTIRRVLQGTDSIECTVARTKGYIALFNRAGVVEPEWPRVTQAWECSDGSLWPDERPAMEREYRFTRNRRAA